MSKRDNVEKKEEIPLCWYFEVEKLSSAFNYLDRYLGGMGGVFGKPCLYRG